ncbi:MAG: DDE-type integrase/transposase/recombinase [Candidatus Delongbacteria bacterium]|nr:DDE-type integrase/transposase/recombinase [Candidatus Delongbacteria bacterium]
MRTTIPDIHAERPLDLVHRNFTATRPNQLWVLDFTNVATWRGFAYGAFLIEMFSRRIVGWRANAPLRSDMALDALQEALCNRETDAPFIHPATVGRSIHPGSTRRVQRKPALNRRS